jgi:hypothetical protein
MDISLTTPFISIASTGAGGNYIAFMLFVLGWIFVGYAFSGLSSVLSSIAGIFS